MKKPFEFPAHALDILDSMMPPMPKEYVDWTYRDTNGWMTGERWDLFRQILGEEDHVLLISTRRVRDGEVSYRGQFWISPRGMENLRLYNESVAQ